MIEQPPRPRSGIMGTGLREGGYEAQRAHVLEVMANDWGYEVKEREEPGWGRRIWLKGGAYLEFAHEHGADFTDARKLTGIGDIQVAYVRTSPSTFRTTDALRRRVKMKLEWYYEGEGKDRKSRSKRSINLDVLRAKLAEVTAFAAEREAHYAARYAEADARIEREDLIWAELGVTEHVQDDTREWMKERHKTSEPVKIHVNSTAFEQYRYRVTMADRTFTSPHDAARFAKDLALLLGVYQDVE